MLNDTFTQFKLSWLPYQIRTLQGFAESIKIVFNSPTRPEYDLYKDFYDSYLKVCRTDNTRPLSVRELCKIFRKYEMESRANIKYIKKEKRFLDSNKPKIDYGMEIKLDKLDELINDCKQIVISNGTTIVLQNDWPYYLRVTMVPVDNKIAQAIMGDKGRDPMEKKT